MGWKIILSPISTEKQYGKFSNMASRGSDFSFFPYIHVKNNWYFYFHKHYDHQSWNVGTSRKIDSPDTNQLTTVEFIILRSRDF